MNFIPSKAAKGAAALSLAVVMALPALAGCSMLKAKSEAPAGQEQQVQTQEKDVYKRQDHGRGRRAVRRGCMARERGRVVVHTVPRRERPLGAGGRRIRLLRAAKSFACFA